MKFPKAVPVVVGWNHGRYYPNFAPAAALQANTFFLNLACELHVIISGQMKCKTFVIFKSFQRALYCTPNLFKYFRLAPKNTTSIFRVQQVSEIMIVFEIFFFFKTFSIKFCTWKSNRFFSLHWASPLKMPQSQNRGYESEKMTLKLE